MKWKKKPQYWNRTQTNDSVCYFFFSWSFNFGILKKGSRPQCKKRRDIWSSRVLPWFSVITQRIFGGALCDLNTSSGIAMKIPTVEIAECVSVCLCLCYSLNWKQPGGEVWTRHKAVWARWRSQRVALVLRAFYMKLGCVCVCVCVCVCLQILITSI